MSQVFAGHGSADTLREDAFLTAGWRVHFIHTDGVALPSDRVNAEMHLSLLHVWQWCLSLLLRLLVQVNGVLVSQGGAAADGLGRVDLVAFLLALQKRFARLFRRPDRAGWRFERLNGVAVKVLWSARIVREEDVCGHGATLTAADALLLTVALVDSARLLGVQRAVNLRFGQLDRVQLPLDACHVGSRQLHDLVWALLLLLSAVD